MGLLFFGIARHHPVPAAGITQLATEMQAGHMGQYGNQVEGAERYQQVIKILLVQADKV